MRALVIGGGSGIGAALAARHRADGTETVVWDVAGDRDVTCDISHPEQIAAAVSELPQDLLPDLVTITAGIGHSAALVDATSEDWDHVMAVNARGPWLCLRALAQALREAEREGSFVATSSVSAHLADRSMGLYCASKAALDMLIKVAAAEWGPWGIRVNAIAPGVTVTPMLTVPPGLPWLEEVAGRTALGRLGSADDIAGAVVALHAMSWVTGQVVDCDGGLSLHSPIDPPGAPRR